MIRCSRSVIDVVEKEPFSPPLILNILRKHLFKIQNRLVNNLLLHFDEQKTECILEQDIAILSEQLGHDSYVIRVWFYNKRQATKKRIN